jgi:hypothetical protein
MSMHLSRGYFSVGEIKRRYAADVHSVKELDLIGEI